MSTPTPETVRLMARLADALGEATRPSTVGEELQRIAADTRGLFSAAACSCALIEPDGERLRFVAADGAGAKEITGVILPVGRGLAGWAATSGQALLIGRVQDDARFARDVAEQTGYVPDAIMAAPMVDDAGNVLGVIEVLDPARSGSEHSGQLLQMLGVIATLATSVVRLSALFDDLAGALFGSLEGSGTPEELGSALVAMVDEDDDSSVGLTSVASAFHGLASAGPDEAVLAERLLAEIARYVRRRR